MPCMVSNGQATPCKPAMAWHCRSKQGSSTVQHCQHGRHVQPIPITRAESRAQPRTQRPRFQPLPRCPPAARLPASAGRLPCTAPCAARARLLRGKWPASRTPIPAESRGRRVVREVGSLMKVASEPHTDSCGAQRCRRSCAVDQRRAVGSLLKAASEPRADSCRVQRAMCSRSETSSWEEQQGG